MAPPNKMTRWVIHPAQFGVEIQWCTLNGRRSSYISQILISK